MFRMATCILFSFILIACGGTSSDSTSNTTQVTLASQNAVNTGFFINPFGDELVQGNLLISYSVKSTGTIDELQLRFGSNFPVVLLCKGDTSCRTKLINTVSGINPGFHGASAGLQEISLWIINTSGQSTKVATLNINWQPIEIINLNITRSEDGRSISINWPLDHRLIRYNVYLATSSGVNQTNFTTLAQGQARLAIEQGPIEFNNLSAELPYYLMVAGIDGSGESAFSTEQYVDIIDNYADLPIANNDNYDAIENNILIIAANQGLLVNDSDPIDQTLVVNPALIQAPSNGQIVIQTSGALEYTPNANFLGNDNFIYQIENMAGATAQANVNINIAALKSSVSGNSSTINSQLRYSGLGEELPRGSTIGTGRYALGDCLQHIDTRCTVMGNYIASTTGDTQGRYAFTLSYGGVGVSPVLAHSVAPASDELAFTDVGDAIFELNLFPNSGGIIVGLFPEATFSESINFAATIMNDAVCQNLPAGQACTIAQTGMNAGAELVASLNQLTFDIPASSLGSGANHLPSATDDQYQMAVNTSLTISQPGVLLNDVDDDVAAVGDQLSISKQFTPAIGALVGLGYDRYRQFLYLYPALGAAIYTYDRNGIPLQTLDLPGEPANNIDLAVASQSFNIANTFIPQGSILVINGETAEAEIYALDATNGVLLAELPTKFGNSHVVGGTYNTKTNSFFLLQDSVSAVASNTVAEVNAQTGDVLNTFQLTANNPTFSVRFGDIAADPITGNLYVISSILNVIAEYTANGDFIRQINLPQGVMAVNGIELSENGGNIWLSSNLGDVYELIFNNGGQLSKFTAEIKKQPDNGILSFNRDGSFIYTPNNGFTGQDSFVYLCNDQNGGISSATVVIGVN
ncbi:Ig-like domain-containing protein [Colwellia hornerae]|uniref:RapA2 cadherin-like domain-containing protein n=1 Tax=Colwellia hornerae TaxID=89402 RepID=A0A5C6QLJ7_9GAMM|nr:Ig-like domain-containing protein [Colwellia hornerae]TWX53680.1 hypothetical protein ESZ28_09370 [Colwellia hornerae]TWX60330.1 hypothetical protein ESZ26_08145 [Colwellia hornerae]TWX70086.1 hypothetical protein ESZ27_04835 [Colwellia hornerae]